MKRLAYAALLTLVGGAASCVGVTMAAQAEGAFDRILTVSGTPTLDVSTGSGATVIRTGATDRVEIHGRIRAGENWFGGSRGAQNAVRELEANPPIEQSGQTIRIGRVPNREALRNVSISYEVVVPPQTNVSSHSGSGGQTVEGVNGRVAVDTGSGAIRIRDLKGDLNAHTGSGSIDARGFAGTLRVETGSGHIGVQGEQSGQWELRTGSGGIDLDLPPNASFELSAHTGSGGVEVAYPMTVQGRLDRRRHDVSGKVGSGGPLLAAHTGSGHIRIQ